MTDLNSVASQIIRRSIFSSVYIDDNIVEPFSEDGEDKKDYYSVSSGLYQSFRSQQKSIDFYKYPTDKNWLKDSQYLFGNRDLIILDWQLNDTPVQIETLKILKKAVNTDNLHFVSIYTATDPKDFNDIFYSIKAFFNNQFGIDSAKKCELLLEAVDNDGADASFLDSLSGRFKEYALSSANDREEIYELIKNEIMQNLGSSYRVFVKNLREVDPDPRSACEILGYFLNKELFIEKENDPMEVNTRFIGEKFIVINHTIVQITNKNAPKPEDLFNVFTDAVKKVCGNLLTLTSLEIRNLLRESSAFVGKDADSIEDAILFHQKNKKENFLEFLMSILKGHTFSHFNYKQGKILTMQDSFWEYYSKENQISDKIGELENEEIKLYDQLAKLNVYYNELHVRKGADDIVKFGDVYFSLGSSGKSDGKFFLCITAHCDCLKPRENIKNNFFFIGGELRSNIKEALKEGDGEFNSYVNYEGRNSALKWNPRPIVFRIENNKLQDLCVAAFDGVNRNYNLRYLTTLKENYAQRMANNSFAFAMRVGIDFASI